MIAPAVIARWSAILAPCSHSVDAGLGTYTLLSLLCAGLLSLQTCSMSYWPLPAQESQLFAVRLRTFITSLTLLRPEPRVLKCGMHPEDG